MGDPDEGGGGEYTSIDVDALGQAVDDLDATLTGLTDNVAGLESDFGYFGVSKTNLNKLLEAKSDLETIMPAMRRRHSLAVQLLAEQQTNGWAGDGVLRVQGSDILNDDFASVEEAQNAGNELADQVNESDGEIPPEVYEQLEQYGDDPDFAEAFINRLSPEARALLLMDADIHANGGGGEDADDGPQLALAKVFSTASFRIDYDAEFFRQMNDALRDLELPGPSIRAMETFLPLLNHGDWDHESLAAVAEAATSGDTNITGMTNAQMWGDLWSGLARNPRASAEFMAEHPDRVWEGAQFGQYEHQEAYANFVKAATVDANSVYFRLRIYDKDLPNLAEQNATYLIEQVGALEEPFPFNDHMRMTFVAITEEYWDSLVYTYSSPGGVANNPGRDGIEVSAGDWEKFVTEGMRNPEGAAQLHNLISEWYDDAIEDTAGAPRPGAHEWDRKVANGLAGMFASSWNTVVDEFADDEAAREEFITTMVDKGVDLILDPKGTVEGLLSLPKDLLVGAIKQGFASFITNATRPDGLPDLDYDFTGTNAQWVNGAVDEYNARRDGDGIPPYNDGDVTWDGDPAFYEELYGAEFTDSSGNVLNPNDPDFPQVPVDPNDPDGPTQPDPAALHAFNQWAQDPAVQLLMSEWNIEGDAGGN